ncbi:MAG: hypothetical protein EOP32_22785 [Rhodococcus sp. (in: high G+C Gram-positive bacteria)]|nr:MAG: hypothetical protein EOP32_22785 [Rhodococcus sp. (in: high G+C Gram-positive bacteria)]
MSSQQIPQQHRPLAVLVGAPVLSGAGLAAGITLGALLAQDMQETTSLADLPSAMFTIGSAAAAVTVGRISQRLGRRTGLTLGYAAGALGSLGVVAAGGGRRPVTGRRRGASIPVGPRLCRCPCFDGFKEPP